MLIFKGSSNPQILKKMKFVHLSTLVALFATFFTSCGMPRVSYSRGGSCPPGYGGQSYGQPYGQPGYGGQYGQQPRNMAPRWAAAPYYGGTQNNGSMAWDGRSTVVRFPQGAQQFGEVTQPLPVQGYSQPLYQPQQPQPLMNGSYVPPSPPRLTASGNMATCPSCHARIGNAPRGAFPCQRCNATVSN